MSADAGRADAIREFWSWWEATGEELAKKNTIIDEALAARIVALPDIKSVKVKPYVSRDVLFLTADEDDRTVLVVKALGKDLSAPADLPGS